MNISVDYPIALPKQNASHKSLLVIAHEAKNFKIRKSAAKTQSQSRIQDKAKPSQKSLSKYLAPKSRRASPATSPSNKSKGKGKGVQFKNRGLIKPKPKKHVEAPKVPKPEKPEKPKKSISLHDKRQQAEEEQKLLARSKIHQLVNYLVRKTHFDSDQVRALIEMYRKIASLGKIDRLRFREMLHNMLGLTDDLMLDRTFAAFDGDNEGSVSESEWVIGLSVLMRGTLEEQISYCYQVYDVNGDQAIGREELTSCLRGCLYSIPGQEADLDLEEGAKEMVELAMRKLDLDRDGSIKFHDFHEAVNDDPLLLQAIGECLPTDKAMMTFLSLIDTATRNYSCFLSHPNDPSWEREANKFDPDAIERNKKHKVKTEANVTLKSVFRNSADERDPIFVKSFPRFSASQPPGSPPGNHKQSLGFNFINRGRGSIQINPSITGFKVSRQE